MECDFCKKNLSSLSALKYHQKSAKYCLITQGSTSGSNFDCNYCDRKFNTKQHLITHHISCKEKKSKDKLKDKEDIKEKLTKDFEKEKEELKKEFDKEKNELKIKLENKNVFKDTFFKLILENEDITNINIRSDGYINATQLCKAGRKDFDDYQKTKQTQDYLQALSYNTGIPNTELIIDIEKGGIIQGTYVHRKLVYHLVQWISPSFAVQVLNVLENLNNEKILIQPQPIKKINNDMTFKLILGNGEIINISIRSDGYINATQLCKAGGKTFSDYQKTKQTQDYLQVLSSDMNILITDLVNIKQGGINQGTYVHRKVAYHMAQWLSPSFTVQVSNILDNLLITGKVELGNEKSNKELDYLYQEKINNLQNELDNKNNKLKNYETTIFDRNIDYCPIEYYGKDIVYFLKFNIPINLYTEYISKYPNLDNKEYSCIEFGVSSDFEKRLMNHKRDRKKDNIIFLHAIELKKRYTASKMELYLKTIAQQLNIKFYYEKRKECVLVNEEMFNILVNKIHIGLDNLEEEDDENEKENYYEQEKMKISNSNFDIEIKKLDNEIEIKKLDNEKEIEIKKIEMITELVKNKLITIDEFKNMLSLTLLK